MVELRTDAELLSALEIAAKHKLSADELKKQRLSFIRSVVKQNADLTDARVKEALADQEGTPAT
jgi:hypothetical protein